MELMELMRCVFEAMGCIVLVVRITSYLASFVLKYAAHDLASEDFSDLPLRFSVNHDWLWRILDLSWH